MSNEIESKTKEATSKGQIVDSSKLVSLLALAAGAVVMPETGNAGIVYNDLSSNPVTVGGTTSFMLPLPGNAGFVFQAQRSGAYSVTSSRRLVAGQAAGYVRLKTHSAFAVHVTNQANLTWNQLPASAAIKSIALLGRADYSHYIQGSYDHHYLPFEFKDSSQGNLMLYGWVDISLNNTDFSTRPGGPILTIWRYAYDDIGNQIVMGQTTVPEPASTSLMALGALALGARGVRAWRKSKKS
jgi:hypothetical protein